MNECFMASASGLIYCFDDVIGASDTAISHMILDKERTNLLPEPLQ